ncbi:MAG: hypothetical protein O7C03_01995 [Gammaproteobacteria bacterium]|nr:hypothetical protein [Gammaproteobacteria bacterium]MCZ6686201.1 hypothetical protein [Gammaproteobacteria bacterium]MCZ6761752.1 hypothetical protein [Gammaproteobacteria bacterium]MCZ6880357.1 hypothetical protein [Gammaproteobacteria bacterium]
MSGDSRFENAFESLKSILTEFSGEMVLVKNEPGSFHLDTKYIMKNKKPMFFGAVRITKSYVSYHLMPVYVFSELLSDISPELKRRMQGKSCFNFKSSDQELFRELAELTAAGYRRYKEAGYV